MKTFDNESFILENFSSIKQSEFHCIGNFFKCGGIYLSLKCFSYFHNWVDTSKSNDPPPDFYNKNLKLMMDVMRFDDSSFIDANGKIQNPIYRRESEIMHRCFDNDYKNKRNDISCFISVTSGLHGSDDHNFERYFENFKRTFNKHNKSIDLYCKNHPGYKTVLFLFDESTQYVEVKDEYFLQHSSLEPITCKPHIPFIDTKFLSIIESSKTDYVVWQTPYKLLRGEHNKIIKLPRCCIIERKSIKKKHFTAYNYDLITSIER